MHTQQKNFCSKIASQHNQHFVDKNVVDFGSADVNGNNRYLFTNCTYTGIDVGPFRNVDVVSKAHEYQPPAPVDTVISSEMLEHDKHWRESVRHMVDILKPGGMLMFTCATTGRAEHGTRRSDPSSSPITSKFDDWQDYYCNLTEADIRSVLDVENEFSSFGFEIGTETCDLYFWGIKNV